MRPQTLAEVVERIKKGEPQDVMLAEFVDTFDLAKTNEGRYALDRAGTEIDRRQPA